MHLFILLHSEMPKALTILSAVINKKNFVSLKKVFDEGQHTKCFYLPYYTQKCPKL